MWQKYETNQTFHTAKTITPYASASADLFEGVLE